MGKVTIVIGAIIIALLIAMVLMVNHYRDNAIEYKKQRDDKTQELGLASATITDIQTRQRDVAALDAKYTKELADAQKTISDLRDDVESGRKQLRVAATCSNVRKPTGTAGMDDAASPRLTDSAQRDYFTLRERIETIRQQLKGTQGYILEQCR